MRTASRSSAVFSTRRITTAPTCWHRRGSTSTSPAASEAAPRRSPTSPAAASSATSSACSRRAAQPSSTGPPGSAPSCSVGSPGTSTRTSCAGSSTSASAGARSWRRRPPTSPRSGGSRDRRPRQRHGHESPGPDRRRASRDSRRLEPPHSTRVATRARGRDPDRHVQPRLPCRPNGARPRDGVLARGAPRRAGRPRRLHAPAHRAVPSPLPRPDRQRSPLAASFLPGRACDRRRARGRRRDDRRHRSLRRRGPRHGTGDRPGADPDRAARDARRAHPRGRAPPTPQRCQRALSGRALISVWEKEGVEAFARGLRDLGFELVSSGGTAAYLEEQGLPVTRVEEVTAAPEMLGGRVKTLHPRIHAGILARRDLDEDVATLAEHEIEPFDVVCVNLYPFTSVASRIDATEAETVEMIDVGGPSMLRAAAKNFAHVAAVSSAGQYHAVLTELREGGEVSLETRRRLAGEAFQTTAAYEAAIAAWF